MRTYENVGVELGTLHVVNPRREHLGLSEAELDLEDGVGQFLVSHINRGLQDPQATAARFIVTRTDRASGICQSLLDGGTDFIGRSAQLATLLYDVSLRDERVTDGTLAILRCVSDTTPFLGIVKLDPANGYRPVEEVGNDGRKRIRLALEVNILPSVRERLQKAIFVRSTQGDDYHMLLVDRQRPGDTVSRFFIQDFLEAESVFDSKERTTILYRELANARNDVAHELSPDELAQLRQYLDGQVVGGRVNVDVLVAGLPTTDEVKQRFKDRLDAALPDREFDLDEKTARGYLRQRRFGGDNGLRLTVRRSSSVRWLLRIRLDRTDDGPSRFVLETGSKSDLR